MEREGNGNDMNEVEREVWRTVEALNRAWTEGDSAELRDHFHRDMVAITPVDPHPLVGGEACAAAWARYARMVRIGAWRTADARVRVFGDAAVVTYGYELTGELDGHTVKPAGRDMMVLVRKSGRWQVVADQFSPYPSRPEPAGAARGTARGSPGTAGAGSGAAAGEGAPCAAAGRRVTVFFYGSYMNPDVLAEVNMRPERFEVARLSGYDLHIRPLANLVRSDEHTVFGVLAAATHAELERLYAHARSVLGEIYLPDAVVVSTADGRLVPALCYIATSIEDRPADPAYVERILAPARRLGFPEWYLRRIEAFR